MNKAELLQHLENKYDQMAAVSAAVWSTPELGFKEFESIKPLVNTLEAEGFAVEIGVAEVPTAFVGTWGEGKPVIGFLGEFDALPGLSQVAGQVKHEAIVEGGNGHGCGHNALGTGCLAAAIGLKDYLKANNLKGTVKYFGCPGEETGSGKVFMAREGVFDDTDIALAWHPSDHNEVVSCSSLADTNYYFKFKGKPAHAAACPELGRSALDACELTNVGVNYLREHMIDQARIHYAYVNAGCSAPNVVHDEAIINYEIRAPKIEDAVALAKRVIKVAQGAALMTETELEIIEKESMCNVIPVESLDKLMYESMIEVGAPKFTDEDYAFAQGFRVGLTEEEKCGDYLKSKKALGVKNFEQAQELSKKGLADQFLPFKYDPDYIMSGSTDVGDVSYVTPTSTVHIASWSLGVQAHTKESTAQSNSPICHKGLLCAGKIMALTAVKLVEDPSLVSKIQAEHKVLVPNGYVCPISKDIKAVDIKK